EVIMEIAYAVAALPGADQPVRAAPPVALGIITLGGLWLALWRGRVRLIGVAVVLAGLLTWSMAPPRPELLIAPGGRLIGMMGPEGRALDTSSAQKYAASTWLRRDGDMAAQSVAAARPGLQREGRRFSAAFGNGWRLESLGGRPEPADLAALCQPRTLLIARNGGEVEGSCVYFGERELR